MGRVPGKTLKRFLSLAIFCSSNLLFQILQQKLNEWRKIRQINVDYRPASHPFVHKMACNFFDIYTIFVFFLKFFPFIQLKVPQQSLLQMVLVRSA